MTVIPYGSPQRQRMLRRAIDLEWVTLGWNLLEALIAIAAATAAASVALLGFGLDSLVESASAAALLWRLRAEQAGREARRAESRARRIAGGLLIGLALFVALDASAALWRGARSLPSALGLAVTSVSIVVMVWLAGAKRRCAEALGSRALAADAFQATACWWLLVGCQVHHGAHADLEVGRARLLRSAEVPGLAPKLHRDGLAALQARPGHPVVAHRVGAAALRLARPARPWAGASFTPSPTIATTRPRALTSLTFADFSCGSTSAK
jgi:hypothetical protein